MGENPKNWDNDREEKDVLFATSYKNEGGYIIL